MPTATMTSVERVNAFMERRDQDRVPRHETFWSDTIRRWQGEGLDGDAGTVLDRLESDFAGCCWLWPAPFPGRNELVSEDDETRIVINNFGQTERQWKHRSGTPEHHGFACRTRDDWADLKRRIIEHPCHVDLDNVRRQYDRARAAGRWVHLTGVESFETLRRLMGDEISLMAMVEDPDWIVDVSRTHTDITLRDLDRMLELGIEPDGLWIYGDMAFNHATMCSPDMYKQLIWPDHKRLCDWAHDRGMKFIYHTDGCVSGVTDLWVEAGFDCFQPIEAKAHMDVRELCPRYADAMSFFGNIDVMVMSTNDPRKIEDQIQSKFAAGMTHRNYAYHSDHSVPPAVSWDTYQFIIECVNKYGWYE